MEVEITDNEDYCLHLNDEIENLSDSLENWMENKKCDDIDEEDSHSPSTVFSLKTDPLLSQVQMDENSIVGIESSFESINLPKTPPKKPKPKDLKRPNILKSLNKIKKIDLNMNSVVNSLKKYKNEVLQERSPVGLEMINIRNGIGIFIKDANMYQMFLTQHIKTVSPPSQPPIKNQIVKCVNFQPLCDKSDITLPQIVTNIGSKVHLCPIPDCTEAFLQPATAKSHALKHLGIKPYNCTYPGCFWEFYNQNKLQRHFLTHKPVKKNYICQHPGCNRDFTTIYNLNEHKKKRHVQPATKLCPVINCDMVFRNDRELRSHCKTHKGCEAPYICDIENCKRTFFTQSTLLAHSRSHQFENNNICHFPNCGKIYSTAYRLKEHIRSHTGTRPYICQFEGCIWRFTTSSKLKRHEKTHNKERKFQCTMDGCNKCFTRSEHLRDHTLTHIDAAKPQECEVCGMSCTNKSAHIKKYHGDFLKDDTKNAERKTIEVSVASVITKEVILENCVAVDFCDKTEDELLEEAIKSLGVPELLLEEQLLPEPLELLESEDFSTVNLKDLD